MPAKGPAEPRKRHHNNRRRLRLKPALFQPFGSSASPVDSAAMPDPRPRRKIAWKPILGLLLIAAALTWLGVLAQPYFSRERMEVLVRGAGAWGPFLLLALQVAQILVAPIPGVFVPILSGLLYGPLVGTAVAAAGTMLGSSAAHPVGRGGGGNPP